MRFNGRDDFLGAGSNDLNTDKVADRTIPERCERLSRRTAHLSECWHIQIVDSERANRWGKDNPVRFVRSMGEIVLWNVEIKLQVCVGAVSLSPLCPPDPGAALLKFGVSVWKVSAGPEAVLRSLPNGESLV